MGNAPWLKSFTRTSNGPKGPPQPAYDFGKFLMEVPMRTPVQRLFLTAILASGVITPVQAEDVFYIVYDKTMHGCTIVTTEPSDKTRYETKGRYKTESEAEKAITSVKEC